MVVEIVQEIERLVSDQEVGGSNLNDAYSTNSRTPLGAALVSKAPQETSCITNESDAHEAGSSTKSGDDHIRKNKNGNPSQKWPR